ncbi:MAG: hypothetical protein HWN65_09305 [Candidatus Helarchaeota archaeon]|nr:hypothetical protein [Candidatus Helarchaeota archaeon]
MGLKRNQKQYYGGIIACTGGFLLFIAMIVTMYVKFEEISVFLPFVLTAIGGGIAVLAGFLILKDFSLGGYIAVGCGIFNYIGNFIAIDSLSLTLPLSTLNLAALCMIIGGILSLVSKTEPSTV